MASSSSSSVVAGWEADRVLPTQGRVTLAEALVQGLQSLGVRTVFGIVGGGIAPFADAVARSSLSFVHTRHEAGATFGATEAFFATGAPSAAFVTTGPGLTNAITGVMAARWDGAKVVLLSGYTSSGQRGRFGVQETTASTMPAGLLTAGPVFDYANTLNDLRELPQVLSRLAHGFARPEGFVAHLALPLELQGCSLMVPELPPVRTVAPCRPPQSVVDLMAHGRTPIWVGYGARGAAASIRALAERTGAAVMSSPRAKGIFPETHPQYLGVTGVGGHDNVARYLEVARPEHVLVLGSRLGEVTSIWDPRLCPRRAFIHVDVDPSVFGASYGAVETLGVQAEIGSFVEGLLERLPEREPRTVDLPACPAPPSLEPRPTGPVRPRTLLAAVQRVVVEGSDALVMTESGNAFGWGNHLLRFETPRYRTSAAFGSMGHFVTGVVGAALARDGKAVALVGDGAMLMNNEISTAVRYGANAVWVVLNDARYGITDQAMTALGFEPVETLLPSTDFVAFARAMGAEGIAVEHELELDKALRLAMRHDGPFVVDVRIDPAEINPVLAARVASLERQGTNPKQETT